MSSSTKIDLSNAYTIGKYKRVADFVNDNRLDHVPGSSKYDPILPSGTSRVRSAQKWSMSKAKRFPDARPVHPGPAEYLIPSKIVEGPRFTTRPKPPIDPFKCRTKPGPGDYNPDTDKPFCKLSYSITGMNEVVPKQSRMKEINPPGPGTYKPDHLGVRPKSAIFSVGKDYRVMTKPANIWAVAPGSHQTKSSFGIGPQFSCSMKERAPRDHRTPGPG